MNAAVAPDLAARSGMLTDPAREREPLTVDVLICTHTFQRWEDLKRALASVAAQSIPPERTVLVVDHNEELLEQARRSFSGIEIVRNTRARGNAGARNEGLARCAADIVACLDDDAVADTDWLERLLNEYVDDRVLGVGGLIRPRWSGHRPRWFPDEFGWVVGCSYRGLPQSRSAIRNLIGANMSMRREVALALGGFSEDLGREGLGVTGHEETELCIRGLERYPAGRWVYTPDAAVLHNVPPVRVRWQYFLSRCYGEGLSKASMTRLAGPRSSLETERAYLLRAIPTGISRGISDLMRGDLSGVGRSAAIVVGVAVTCLGYVRGLINPGLNPLGRLT